MYYNNSKKHIGSSASANIILSEQDENLESSQEIPTKLNSSKNKKQTRPPAKKSSKNNNITNTQKTKPKRNNFLSDENISSKLNKKQKQQDQDQFDTVLDNSQTLKKGQLQKHLNLEKTIPNGGSATEVQQALSKMKDNLFKQQNQNQQQLTQEKSFSSQDYQINNTSNDEIPQLAASDKDMLQMAEKAFSRQGSMDVNFKHIVEIDDQKYGLQNLPEHSKYSYSQISATNLPGGKQKKMTQFQLIKRQIEEDQIRKKYEKMEKERKIQEQQEKKKNLTKLEKVVKIQAFFRKKLAQKYHRHLKRRLQLLQNDNRAINEIKEFEQHCLENYFQERDKVFVSNQFSQTFSVPQGKHTLSQLGELKNNVFYPTLFKALAEQGNLDILVEEKESEQQFNNLQKQKFKLQRPKTAETHNGFVHQYVPKPEKEIFFKKSGLGLDYKTQLKKDKHTIIDNFVRSNQPHIINHAKSIAKQGGFQDLPNEVQLRKLNKNEFEINSKINTLKQQLDKEHQTNIQKEMPKKPLQQQQQQQDNSYMDSVSYGSDFEKDSSEFQQSSQNFGKKKSPRRNQQLLTDKSKSAISEEDYLNESFESLGHSQSQIKESISAAYHSVSHQKDSMKMSESIKVEVDYAQTQSDIQSEIQEDSQIQEDSIPEDSQIQEDSAIREEFSISKRSKQSGGGIDESIQEYSENYDDEGFESISEDVSQSQIKSSIHNDSYQKQNRSSSFKKSVTFEKNQIPQFNNNNNNSFQKNNINNSNKYQTLKIDNLQQQQKQQQQYPQINLNQTAPANMAPINFQNQDQAMQFQMFQQFQQFQQFLQSQQNQNLPQQQQFQQFNLQQQQQQQQVPISKEIPETIDPEIKKIFEKYQPLKVMMDSEKTQITKEEMAIKKMEVEIEQVLQNTQKISKKWQEEALQTQEKDITLEAESLYTKFQCEFNNLVTANTFGDKLKLLSNFAFYNEMSKTKNQNQSTTGNGNAGNEKSTQILKDMLENVEKKQEVIVSVLTQLMSNLSQLKETAVDFHSLSEQKQGFDNKLNKMVDNQQKLMKEQFDKKLEQRDSQIRGLLEEILQNQKKSSKDQLKKDKLKALLEMNKDPQQVIYRTLPGQEQILKPREINYGDFKFNPNDWKEEFKRPQPQQYYNGEQQDGLDIAAEHDQSTISWQSTNLMDNMSAQEKKQLEEKNTEQVVNYLTDMLLGDIKKELFPLRSNSDGVFNRQRKLSDEMIKKNTEAYWHDSPSAKNKSINSPSSAASTSQNNIGKFSSNYNHSPSNFSSYDRKLSNESQEQDSLHDKSVESQEYNEERPPVKQQDKLMDKSPVKAKRLQQDSFNFQQPQDLTTCPPLPGASSSKTNENSFSKNNTKEKQNQDEELKDFKQDTIHNAKIYEQTKDILEIYSGVLKRKNKQKVIKKILTCLEENEKKLLPQFSGSALKKVKIFEDREIEDIKNEQLVVNAFEEKFIQNSVSHVQQCLNKKITQQDEIIQNLEQKFNQIIEYSSQQVLKSTQQLVSQQFYPDQIKQQESQLKTFDEIYDFCHKQQMPKDKDEDDIGEEFLKYEIEKDHEAYKNKMCRQLYEDIFNDIANEYNEVYEKRKKLL